MRYILSSPVLTVKIVTSLLSEPNQFPNTSVITAKQLAKDYHTLSELLQSLDLKPNYVAGPDVTDGGDDFLIQYYFCCIVVTY